MATSTGPGTLANSSTRVHNYGFSSDNNYWTIHNYQLLVDLHGAFAEHFQKVDGPLKHYSTEIACISKTLLNVQRDITLRRCVVDRSGLLELVAG